MNVENLLIILLALVSCKTFSQSDTASVNPNKLIVNPKFFGVQIEAVTTIATNEIGISGDYDFYTSINDKYNFGLRISTEYFKISDFDVGGGSTYGPYWDIGIYGRHSLRGEHFWFSPLLGLSLHNSFDHEDKSSQILFKWGLELKYNLFKENVGLLFKFLGSSVDNSSFGGVGIIIGFYNK